MKNNEIDRLNDKMEYYKGCPEGTYAEALDAMKGTQVNSCLTSSLPLAEFWQPKNLARINAILLGRLPKLDLYTASKFLEFPTRAVIGGEPRGPESMTDLMIIDGSRRKIAVEGKFTEYVWGPSETCEEWLRRNSRRTGKIDCYWEILFAWLGMIRDAGCTDLSNPELVSSSVNVCYQFLHRAASACFGTNGTEGRQPVLLYQLFYKAGDGAHEEKLKEFKWQLLAWADRLHLKNMKFLILSVPVRNADEVERRYERLKEQENARIFEDMKHGPVFDFDFERIELENVKLLEEGER